MTNVNWEEKPGGLLLAVQAVDTSNPQHLETVIGVMRHTFQAIAQKHGAGVNTNGLRGNVNALLTGRMHADLYLAKWKECADEICLGAAFGWKTYAFTPAGLLVKAEYTEDVALPNNLLRALIRAKPRGMEFPDESLAKCFEGISLRNMFHNKGAKYRFGEVSTDNTTMMRQLDGNSALVGTDAHSAMIEFKRLPNDLMDSFPMNARAIPILSDGADDKNNFYVKWVEGFHDRRFIVTNAQATGQGKPRVDVLGWDNGSLLSKPIQKCVIDSSLLAIKHEVERREWGAEQPVQYPSSMTALFKARPDIAAALYPQSEAIAVPSKLQPTFPAPMPEDAHFSVYQDKDLLDEAHAAGGAKRIYGEKPMKPVINLLASTFG